MIHPLSRLALALKPTQLRIARQHSVQLIYQLEASQQSYLSESTLNGFFNQNEVPHDLYDFIKTIVGMAVDDRERIDGLIEKHAANWKLSRIARVDLAILRICTAELLTRPELPRDVIINEGVELGKQFGSTASGSFINGVLDALARSIAVPHNVVKTD